MAEKSKSLRQLLLFWIVSVWVAVTVAVGAAAPTESNDQNAGVEWTHRHLQTNETNSTVVMVDDNDNSTTTEGDNMMRTGNGNNTETTTNSTETESPPSTTTPNEFTDLEVTFTYLVESNSTLLNRGNTEALIVEFEDDVLADLRGLIESTDIDDYITINSATSNYVDSCTGDTRFTPTSDQCAIVATLINATVTNDRDPVLVKTAFFDELAFLIDDYESENDLKIRFLGPNPLSAEVVFTLGGLSLPTPTSEMTPAEQKIFQDAVFLVLQDSFQSDTFELELTGVSVLSQTTVDQNGRTNRCNPNIGGRRGRELQENCRRNLQGGNEDKLRVRTYVTAFHTPPPEMNSETFPIHVEETMSDNTPYFISSLQDDRPQTGPGGEPGPSQQPPGGQPPPSTGQSTFFSNVQIVAIEATVSADEAVEEPPVLQSPEDPLEASENVEGESSIPLWSVLTLAGCLFVLVLGVAYVVVQKRLGKDT